MLVHSAVHGLVSLFTVEWLARFSVLEDMITRSQCWSDSLIHYVTGLGKDSWPIGVCVQIHCVLLQEPSVHYDDDDDDDNDDRASEDTLPLGGCALPETRAEVPFPTRTSWGQMTTQAMAEQLVGKKQVRPLHMATACSGTGAPSFAAEVFNAEKIRHGSTGVNALDPIMFTIDLEKPIRTNYCTFLRLDFIEYFTCDKKVASQKFLQKNGRSKHHFSLLQDMNKALRTEPRCGLPCKYHKKSCPIELPKLLPQLDTLIIGFPCAPYSAARTSRWHTGWISHPEVPPMLESIELIAQLTPATFIAENVMGFGQGHNEDNKSALAVFCDKLSEIGYHTLTLETDLAWWHQVTRKRYPTQLFRLWFVLQLSLASESLEPLMGHSPRVGGVD
eukprot:5012224-Amphidinium_carterae.6